MFWVEKDQPTVIRSKAWRDSPENEPQHLRLVSNTDEVRREEMCDTEMTPLNPPGLPEMKQVDLYFKFRPFVPDEYKDNICPKPPDDVIQRIQGQSNKKSAARNQEKTKLTQINKVRTKAEREAKKVTA